ncbi:hypothetical protein Dsin_030645 [Dipteronia sinensis]|uniref:Uncharacterized protein n=1 Tax=Dipteronia sinensis TaxID=43782 RepID=A0AAD9ZLH4_9ROSI|nr:hypothetical protein Dsin_030645 [Dipteronia sinensis]
MEKRIETPMIIAMKGHPGSGKTTLARSLASALRIPLIDKDDIRDSTFSIQNSQHSLLLNDLSYDAAFRVASTQLNLGLSVVIDSPLSCRARLDDLLRSAAPAGARVIIVECKPSDEAEWRRRLETRGGSSWHKPSTWHDLERLLQGYGGCTEYDVGDVPKVMVDTTAPVELEELVSRLLEFILSHSAPSVKY